MPTLNATVFPDEAYVLVEVDWTDNTLVKYASVTRRNTVTGEIVTLRPHIAYDAQGNQLLNCGIGIWWDTEPPLNVPLEYCTHAVDVETILNSNPGFESGTAPWAPLSGTLVQSALNPHSGSFSGLFTPPGGSSVFITDNTAYSVTGGIPFTFSAWVLSPQGWNSVMLTLFYTLADAVTHTIVTDPEIIDDNEYRFLSTGPLTLPSDATVTAIQVGFFNSPPNTTLFYVDDITLMQARPVADTACETVTVTSDNLYLKSPLHPCSDLTIDLCNPMFDECVDGDGRVSYAGMDDDEYDPNTVLLYPVNRRRPIPVNRVRRDARSGLNLITHTCEALQAVKLINEPGDPLLWQDGTGDYCIEDRYMSVAAEIVRHIGVDQRDDFRFVQLPYVVVDRPEGPADGPCGTRIDDLCDLYASWDAMEGSDLDWIDLPTGGASDQSPGNPPVTDLRTWDEAEVEFASWDTLLAGGTRDWDELKNGL